MRKVRVSKYIMGKLLDDGEAVFHGWGCAYEEFETGPGNYSTAIIERADGTIETPEAHLIKFMEKA